MKGNIVQLWGIRHIGQYSRFLIIKKELERFKFTDVLDAGCGSGLYSKYISARFPDARIVALDLFKRDFERELEINPELKKRIAFIKEDLVKITFRDRFDLILNINVLRNIDDNLTVLKNFYGALKQGGLLILEVPSQIQERGATKLFDGWHFARGYLVKKLEEIGFKIDTLKYTFGTLGTLAWKAYLFTEGRRLTRAFILPFLKVMIYCDTMINHKTGSGLLIVARKP